MGCPYRIDIRRTIDGNALHDGHQRHNQYYNNSSSNRHKCSKGIIGSTFDSSTSPVELCVTWHNYRNFCPGNIHTVSSHRCSIHIHIDNIGGRHGYSVTGRAQLKCRVAAATFRCLCQSSIPRKPTNFAEPHSLVSNHSRNYDILWRFQCFR